MSIRSAVVSQIQQVATETNKDLPSLTDDLALLESGLDSLTIAIIVTRLEDALGLDPFTESDDVSYPVTVGDFIRFYENAANMSRVAAGEAR
jgi:acyl carrier protein